MSEEITDVDPVRFDAEGLITAVVRDVDDGAVLMVAWMSREALEATLAGPHVTFWSRSRQELWTKGDTSGNRLEVVSVEVDCDVDTLLVSARPTGPACHTGTRTCFLRPLTSESPPPTLSGALGSLAGVLASRVGGDPDESYTAKLLAGGPAAYGAKIQEEAGEVAAALANESDERVVSEAADVLYHLAVGLTDRGLSWADVAAELDRRSGTSGLEEKRSR